MPVDTILEHVMSKSGGVWKSSIPAFKGSTKEIFGTGLVDASVRGGVTGGALYGILKLRGETKTPRKKKRSKGIAIGAAGLAAGGPPVQRATSAAVFRIAKFPKFTSARAHTKESMSQPNRLFTPVGGSGGILKNPRSKPMARTLKPPGMTVGELGRSARPATTTYLDKKSSSPQASVRKVTNLPKFPSNISSIRIKPVRAISPGLEKMPGVQALKVSSQGPDEAPFQSFLTKGCELGWRLPCLILAGGKVNPRGGTDELVWRGQTGSVRALQSGSQAGLRG